GFLSAAAAQFGHHHRRGQAIHDVVRVPPQQAFIGPCEPVLGKGADHFEQSRAHIVIQIFRGQLFLAAACEAGTNVGGEFVNGLRRDGVGQHDFLSASRSGILRKRIGNAAGTSCGTSAVTCSQPCAASCLSSRNVCRRKNRRSSPGKTKSVQSRGTERRCWTSIPSRCPEDRAPRTRFDRR